MSFTPVVIQGRFAGADGSPSAGTICFTPTNQMVNGEEIQSRAAVCGVLDAEGRIVDQGLQAFVVSATDDSGTTPVGSAYTVTLSLVGQDVVEFTSVLPHTAINCPDPEATTVIDMAVVTLVGVVASTTMIGASVTGSNFTGTRTVIAVDESANQITLNGNATATGTDAALVVVTPCAFFAELQANAL